MDTVHVERYLDLYVPVLLQPFTNRIEDIAYVTSWEAGSEPYREGGVGPDHQPAAPNFVRRVLDMLQSIGWIAAHRFLFADLRVHLLGWPTFLAPDGRRAALRPAAPPARPTCPLNTPVQFLPEAGLSCAPHGGDQAVRLG
jgi:hypothetical protein